MTKIEKYDTLIKAFDQDKAKVIADYVDDVQNELLTKAEFYKSMGDFKSEIQKSIGDLKGELQKSMGDFKTEHQKSMGDFKDSMNTKLWSAFVVVVLLLIGLYVKK